MSETSLTAKGVVRNSAAYVTGEVLAAVFRIASDVFLLSILSRVFYGTFTAAIAFVEPFKQVAIFGLDRLAAHKIASRPQETSSIVGALFILHLVLGAASLIILAVAGYFIRSRAPGGIEAVLAASLIVIPNALYTSMQSVFQAKHQVRSILVVPAVGALTQFLLFAALWQSKAPLIAFIMTTAVADTVCALVLFRKIKTELKIQIDMPSFRAALSLAGQAFPLAYSSIIVAVHKRLGFFFVEAARGVAAVADLGAATKVTDVITFFASALAGSINPYVSSITTHGRHGELAGFYKKLLTILALILIPFASLLAGLAVPVVQRLNPAYIEAAYAFRWLAFASVLAFVCQVSTACLVGLGRSSVVAKFTTVNLITFAVLAWPLSHAYGARGSAIAKFLMEALNAVIQITLVFMYIRRLTEQSPPKRP